MVCPVVNALKRFMSFGSQYMSLLSLPLARLRATAAMMFIRIACSFFLGSLYAYHSRDVWPRVVILQLEILVFEVEDILYIRI